jgi:hypothetical protein
MTTYEKYLQWKSEQTSKAPSIKAFCDYLDKLNQPEMVKQDEFGKIARTETNLACSICVYDSVCSWGNEINIHCNDNNKRKEYYYAKPD